MILQWEERKKEMNLEYEMILHTQYAIHVSITSRVELDDY